MGGLPAGKTSASLLGRLRASPDDPSAWRDFADRYGRQVFDWCRQFGIQDADAEDITQEVFLDLATAIRTFQYDPSRSFRAWLRTLTHRAWCNFLRRRNRLHLGIGSDAARNSIAEAEARDDLNRRLEEEYDRELLAAAVFEVRRRVAPHTWEAFHLLAFEGLPGAEVAARLGLTIGNVYVARSSVQKLLKAQIKKLEEEQE